MSSDKFKKSSDQSIKISADEELVTLSFGVSSEENQLLKKISTG